MQGMPCGSGEDEEEMVDVRVKEQSCDIRPCVCCDFSSCLHYASPAAAACRGQLPTRRDFCSESQQRGATLQNPRGRPRNDVTPRDRRARGPRTRAQPPGSAFGSTDACGPLWAARLRRSLGIPLSCCQLGSQLLRLARLERRRHPQRDNQKTAHGGIA